MPKIRCVCAALLAYRDEQAGRTVKCPTCFAKITLPLTPPPKPQKIPLHGNMDALIGQRLSALAPGAQPPKSPAAPKLGKPVVVKPATEGTGIYVNTTPPASTPASAPGASAAKATPKDELKLDAASDDIPLAGETPTWNKSAPPL